MADPIDLKLDPHNANLGTDQGRAIIRESVRRHGAGRSGVAARDGTMLGGNQTLREIEAAGIKIKKVHTTGDEWVVVVRDDLDPHSPEARELAVADNTAAHEGFNLDPSEVDQLLARGASLEGLMAATDLKALLDRVPIALVPGAPAPAEPAPAAGVPFWATKTDDPNPPSTPPPLSYVRMVQLFLNTETQPLFQELVKDLQPVLEQTNPTDTVMEAIKYAHAHLVPRDE